ncbi:MAG TPA: tetratricopeptide repeat protein [Polyangia bacterium]
MQSPRKAEGDPNKTIGLAPLLGILLLLTALVLSPVLLADFIRLDDYSHLFDNPHLRKMSIAGLQELWATSYFNLYIPITYSVWWAVAMLGRLLGSARANASLFHALNLVIHLANVSLVFFVVRTLLHARRQKTGKAAGAGINAIALTAALFFGIHPVQVETVAWVSELKGGLSTTFGLLGLWLHYRSTKRVLTAACFIAAMLSKPSAIVFPGMVLLVDRMLLGASIRKSAVLPALYTLPLLPLVLVTKHLQPNTDLDFVPNITQRIAVAADAFAFYVYKVLVPFPLAVDYGRSPHYVLSHIPGWQLALSMVVFVVGISVLAEAIIRPRPTTSDRDCYSLVTCGWALFVLSIAPVLGLVPFGFQDISTVADHYLYVSLLGISLMVAGILLAVGTVAKSRLIAVTVLVVLAGLSFQQARLWRSTETLFTQTLKVNPQSYLGYFCIADEHIHAGRFDESIEWLTKSLAINPHYVNADLALGLAWSQMGENERAIDQYRSALAKHPSTVGTRARLVSSLHNNLGMVLVRVGREAEGVAHFHKALEIFPPSVNAHLNLGNLAFENGRYVDALAEYQAAQALNPGYPAVEQRVERARQSIQKALLDNKNPPSLP